MRKVLTCPSGEGVPAYHLTVAGKGVQYSSVFIKGSNEQSEVGMFSHSPYLAVVRFLYKSLKPVFD